MSKKDMTIVFVIAAALLIGAAAFGAWLGWRSHVHAQSALITAKANFRRGTQLHQAAMRQAEITGAETVKYLQWRERTKQAKAAQVVGGQHSAAESRRMSVVVTAYDLSYESCGKSPSHPQYGITANGTDLRGHTLESARAIAVDPDVIPLGSAVRLEFADDAMKRYDGVYTACDTGGGVNGYHIDLFVGEDNRDEAMRIGRRTATATVEG